MYFYLKVVQYLQCLVRVRVHAQEEIGAGQIDQDFVLVVTWLVFDGFIFEQGPFVVSRVKGTVAQPQVDALVRFAWVSLKIEQAVKSLNNQYVSCLSTT